MGQINPIKYESALKRWFVTKPLSKTIVIEPMKAINFVGNNIIELFRPDSNIKSKI
jgi:hypothetical protein